MDKRRLPASLLIVALFQALAVAVLPPDMYGAIDPLIWGIAAALFVLLAINLLRLRDWARTASVFLQGLNIIVRLLTLLSNAVPPGPDAQLDTMFVVTSTLSMLLSGAILYLIEQPDVQLIMQQ